MMSWPRNAQDGKRQRRRTLLMATAIPFLAVGVGYGVYRFLPARQKEPRSYRVESAPDDWVPGASLRVVTLNIAHGRALASHQALCRTSTIEANLEKIAEVLRREQPDAVALQEVDIDSGMTGHFDHAERLAKLADFAHRFHGTGSQRLGYGTALLSRVTLKQGFNCRFKPTGPTPTKNFVAATITFPGTAVEVDVASVHLDFLRGSKRAEQVAMIAKKLGGRGRPLIIMGDFNCSWTDREKSLRLLGEGLGVRPFKPRAKGLLTFNSERPRRRLDWILISRQLDFESYEALPDQVSDHLGVAATIRLRAGGR